MNEDQKSELAVTAPTPDEGVYGKYRVERMDGRDKPGGDKENARYFVLDYVNDPHAMKALRAYIDAVWEDNPLAAGKLVAEIADADHEELPDGMGPSAERVKVTMCAH